MMKSYNKKTILVSCISVLTMSAILTGCNRSINDIAPTPLATAPVTPVTNNSLPPIVDGNTPQVAGGENPNSQILLQGNQNRIGTPTGLTAQQVAQNQAPVTPEVLQSAATNQAVEVASAQANSVAPVAPTVTTPKPTGQAVTREAVSGTWLVASDSPNCRMILAFTKWEGGYRAASRKCASPELATISAWDVSGKQVLLRDGSGNTVGRLFHSGGERYDGTTNSGAAISLTRS